MNMQLSSLMEEFIAVSMEEEGVSSESIDKCIEAIKYNCKETNFLHNSVADSNFRGAEIRKENEKIKSLSDKVDSLERNHRKEMEETISDKNRLIYRLRDRIEELEKELRNQR